MAFTLFKKPVKKVVKHSKPKPKTVKKAIIHKKVVKRVSKPVRKPVTKSKHKSAIKLPIIEKLDDNKAYDMVKSAKLPTLKTIFLKTEKDIPSLKAIGFPCMFKVSSTKIVHKTEVDGIIKVNTPEEADEAFKKLMKIKGAEKVLAQEFKDGIELIIGAKSDPQFGCVVSVGLGGIYVEVFKDVKFRVCPIAVSDAEAMVKELAGYEMLAGARGKPPINFNSLYDLLVRVGNFALKNGINEMDMNPVFCDDKGCHIADIRIIE
ncbi:MAG: acetate--CoA ligase family protein [Nanoarchaeota archaeon]|nr:acetate--CoA ligase family protein [Nanoarchaeota archaeon]MBU4124040.1 acetate--CoA ligase family protein [Nanoarchaeota archaeon]